VKYLTWVTASVVFAVGCAMPGQQPGGIGSGGSVDLSGGTPDVSIDMASPVGPADASVGTLSDLAMPDLLKLADLSKLPDLLTPPPPPDLAPVCTPPVASGICDDAPQCGCGANQNCVPVDFTTGATGCVAAGSIPDNNGGCTGSGANQCKQGSACVAGVCTKICQTKTDCGGGTYTTCSPVENSSGNDIPGFTVCSVTCDPVNPQLSDSTYTPCGTSVNCLPASDRASYCIAPTKSTGTQGADCTTSGSSDQSKCAVGYACLSDVFSSSCYKMCHVGSNADCASGKTCYSFGTKLYAGPKEIGYCDT
jgi:hypothetical protein